jgi:PPP family 3-phenylpropionic acid transporter
MTSLTVIRLQYFIYFAVLGIYLPYFNLYCYHLGFSGTQIGTLSAFRSLVLIIFSLIWGALADRYHIRRSIYICCNMLGVLVWLFYFTTVDFLPMLIITISHGIFYAPLISFLEAFTMDALGRAKASYGRIRAWGSISFILMVVVLGRLIDLYPIGLILVLILAGAMVQSVFSLQIPRITVTPQKHFYAEARSLLAPRVLVFFFAGFLMLASHGAYYGFFSIHLENMGYSRSFIGISWALASIAEIGVMIKSDRIFKRFSLERVLVFSFVIATLRWLAVYFVSSPALILLTQTLHAVTYGTYHMASIIYIDRWTPDKTKTLGQAVNNAVQYGLGLMVGFFLNGYLYEHTGSSALFAASSAVALVGGLIFGGYLLVRRKV